MRQAFFIEGCSKSDRLRFLYIGFIILLIHHHLFLHQQRCRTNQNREVGEVRDIGEVGDGVERKNRSKDQWWKALGLLFFRYIEVAPNELLDVGSVGTNEKEYRFGAERDGARDDERFSKLIQAAVDTIFVQECKREAGLKTRIAKRSCTAGVARAPNQVGVANEDFASGHRAMTDRDFFGNNCMRQCVSETADLQVD
jgi:hypothetical protein